MTDGATESPRSSPERPARSYRALAQQLLTAASHTSSRGELIEASLHRLAAFTACDRLRLWLDDEAPGLGSWTYETSTWRLADRGTSNGSATAEASPEPASSMTVPLAFGDQLTGHLALDSRHPGFFTPNKQSLYGDVAQTLAAALAYHRAQAAQQERVKELSCLYRIARISAPPDRPVEAVLQQIVAILPPAWQHVDIAEARIRLDEHEVQTAAFDEAVHRLDAPITVHGRARGQVSLAYTARCADSDREAFLPEERNLIDAVAREVARLWEQRQAEVERQRLQEQIRHADRLATIGQLAAGVAHELNEPLGSILGFAQLGRKSPDLPEPLDRDLSRIETAALHSREVVRKLSLFARQTPTRREPLDLTTVVREGLFLLESRCRKEDVELVLKLVENLPPVHGDSGQLTQVLMNLVVNAVQAMPGGGTVVVATGEDDDAVFLRVSDTGEGIPPEVCARIFEPFFTTKDVGQGTGLGLSVVHGIVTAHGGQITVQSARHKGTTFTVLLRPEPAHA